MIKDGIKVGIVGMVGARGVGEVGGGGGGGPGSHKPTRHGGVSFSGSTTPTTRTSS